MRLALLLGLALAFTARAQETADPRPGEAAASSARPLFQLFSASPADQFKEAIRGFAQPAVHEHLPAASEATVPSFPLAGYLFRSAPAALAPDAATALQRMFQEGAVFSPGGDIGCAKFAPQFVLIWKSDKTDWYALVGLDCQEIRVVGPGGIVFQSYIPPQAYGQLDRLLRAPARN